MYKLCSFFIFTYSTLLLAGPLQDISMGDDVVKVPTQYYKDKLPKQIQRNKECMLDFLQNEVLTGKTDDVDDLFRTLKSSGYKFNLTVDRYEPTDIADSDEDQKRIREIEKSLKQYAKSKGYKENYLDLIFKQISIQDEYIDNKIAEKIKSQLDLTYDDLVSFVRDRAIKRKQSKAYKERKQVVVSLDKELNVKVPDLQSLWCNKGYQENILKELRRQIYREVMKKLPKQIVQLLKQILIILENGLRSPTDMCDAQQKINKLKSDNFKDFKLHEQSGKVYYPDGTEVTNEILKSMLYSYFYDKRKGLIDEDENGKIDHIIEGSMLDYITVTEGIGKDRKKCIIGLAELDRQGNIVKTKVDKKCYNSKDKRFVKQSSPDDVSPINGKCPLPLILHPIRKMCVKNVECKTNEGYDFNEERCVALKQCESGYFLQRTENDCKKIPICNKEQDIDFISGTCKDKCQYGYMRDQKGECNKFNTDIDRCPNPAMQYFDEALNKCINKPTCKPGYRFNVIEGKCKKDLMCPHNFKVDNDKCVPSNDCKEGEQFNPIRNICVKVECEIEEIYDPIKEKCSEVPSMKTCELDEIIDFINLKCIKKAVCKEGEILNLGFNECEPVRKCEEGFVYISYLNRCFQKLDCPDGYKFSDIDGTCVFDSNCPNGTYYNIQTQECDNSENFGFGAFENN